MKTLLHNALLVNEGQVALGWLLIRDEKIESLGFGNPPEEIQMQSSERYDAQRAYLMPGVIDDQVHFREPGLTHKGDIFTESRAAVAGGITSYMEMPNTQPPTLTLELLESKYQRAAETSWANFSFYMGTSSDNLEEIQRCDPTRICGLKIFLGASTGELYVDDPQVLERVFRASPLLIALHCEKEPLIQDQLRRALAHWGDNIPIREHPMIRSAEACYRSTCEAIELAEKTGARIHVLHISTARECQLFRADLPLEEKRVTAEACIHHLWFTEEDYERLGAFIKWNPAIKSYADREAIRQAVHDGRIDVVATDHAPHTRQEKALPYRQCPSGGPLVQHALPAMMDLAEQLGWSVAHVAELMSHRVARLFRIVGRGFLKPGYQADLVLVERRPWTVTAENILYKCQWSPFEGHTFGHAVKATFVNGYKVYEDGHFAAFRPGQRLMFQR
ncbi:MAG: dihydroorotase [Flavobacteriales bacterium]|nr:dihydroorotase [Flavobacteriales bacterium]MCX7768403.1 dihydroorotase [Flavobacteriales bacterium]MDW8409704.1 dihydroorotase [Flavobacteriales bacterium]